MFYGLNYHEKKIEKKALMYELKEDFLIPRYQRESLFF